MKFKLDENLPLEIAGTLRNDGHAIDTVQDEGLIGSHRFRNPQPRQNCESGPCLRWTKAIADIRIYPPAQYSGIVLFRPSSAGRGEVLRFVNETMPDLLAISLKGKLAIVRRGLRIR